MALTHDGKLLIAANGVGVVFLDVDRLTSGKGDAVSGSVPIGTETGTICVNVTLDDRFLFVSDERHASITVVDLTLARSKGGAAKSIVGEIPVGNLPVALTFSPDGRWLYTTSESAASDWDWPEVCDPEGPAAAAPNTPKHPLGAIVVVDVAKAETDPAHAVASRVPAGCSPVRLAISPQGDRAYVTARKTDAVLVFDAGKLVADAEHAELTRVPVGSAPVPVVVVDGGRKVIAGNSNRFAAVHESSTLTVVDAARAATGAGAVIGTISAGVFPRDLALSRDGRTLFVANWGSDSLQMMDVANLPVDPVH
jgi:DNA-binding beta-propeller fold protein YncE